MFENMIAPTDLAAIRVHTQQQRAWGSDRFRAQMEALAGRAAGIRPKIHLYPSKNPTSEID
ncbi:hypothetical protein RHOFW104T7_15360 [Rhodanobacter thiooxydans]|uniref:Transposase n=2 Tax=Rhodanobacter thiooxydans TaxID=416169 RepID=A0A154QFM4_9GAMM|nr:hypothetical protein RHOFW104T7_15360 [Rhodanobacter thiooxydans]